MKKPIEKARRFLHEAAGHNDNIATTQLPQITFNGPVTIVLGDILAEATSAVANHHNDRAAGNHNSKVPPYLTHRRAILAALPPFKLEQPYRH